MNSSPQPYDKHVNVKLLYTFDDCNTFLARSPSPLLAKILTLPNTPPHNGAQIGCVPLKACLNILYSISPEWFQNNSIYSIYYKDTVESGEPYVATGLSSNITPDILITGRLTSNILNLYQPNSSADTLDIKLRFSSVTNHLSNPSIPRKRQRKSNSKSLQSSDSKNLPQLASRTQSLPFITQDSLAHKIRISDMMLSTVNEEVDATGEPIASRFSNYHKIKLNDTNNNSQNNHQFEQHVLDSQQQQQQQQQPVRARKTKSFIQSVVKIGDNNVSSSTRKKIASISKNCVNCLTNSNPPYKFFKDGIFEMGNSGFLCATCTDYQSNNNIKLLRERGYMGSKGLLDDPYAKNMLNSSSSTSATSSNSNKRPKRKNISSSSPFLSSSPKNLQNGFTTSKKKQSTKSSVIQNALPQSNLTQQQQSTFDITSFTHDDLMSMLKIESVPQNQQLQSLQFSSSLPITHMDDFFTIPTLNSKGNTPQDNTPLNATKLNTTLIPLDDEDKENMPPQKNGNFSTHNISPSIQHIIDSFSNEPSSPSKSTTDWNYDFFGNDNDLSDNNDDDESERDIKAILNNTDGVADTSDSNNVPCTEVDIASVDKYEITPRDVPTQPSDDTETNNTVITKETVETKTTANTLMPPLQSSVTVAVGVESKKSRVMMPSSPFFHVDKTLDSTALNLTGTDSLVDWNSHSSPVTDPLCYSEK
ncbi:hypothetical protein CANINC_003632 [Pichia inconspicua]|uniref:Ams2/SPT21 N-terminal domain-containing protein n=1 Tax=Pichia inconspicua TaxID=52247 RepID=A0A4T0WYA2_9ASCO|nr:hypothetical protein CANINC_003632 [[Candida] inconspicua]